MNLSDLILQDPFQVYLVYDRLSHLRSFITLKVNFNMNVSRILLILPQLKYSFCGEDSTSVVPKISYDTRSNCFIGFTLPPRNGLPCARHFATNSLTELETRCEQVDKSSLINVHVIQIICPTNKLPLPPSFLLSAYGTNNMYMSDDVLLR